MSLVTKISLGAALLSVTESLNQTDTDKHFLHRISLTACSSAATRSRDDLASTPDYLFYIVLDIVLGDRQEPCFFFMSILDVTNFPTKFQI